MFMTYKIFRSQSKKFLREALPWFYPLIYRAYLRLTGSPIQRERAAKYAEFVKAGFYNFELRDITFDIMLDPNNGGVDLEIFTDKNFEARILEFIRAQLSVNDVFVDIGANIGQHSLYASYLCGYVYAFEPIKRLYDQFCRSIFQNEILNITAYNYALGNEKKEMPIYSNEANMGGSSVLVKNNKNFFQNIKILRLDDIYDKIGITRANMIKIDVEGYELEVLLGAQNFIKKCQPKIIMEFSPYFYDYVDSNISNRIIELLLGAGYELWNIGDNGDKKIKVKKLEDLHGASQINLFCTPVVEGAHEKSRTSCVKQ